MDWVFFETKEIHHLSHSQQPFSLPQPRPLPPTTTESGSFSVDSKISPSVLLIIIILAIIFFISGLLHLLVRFLLRPSSRDPEDLDNVTALQGQLQQLFHLHDAGVDQSFIDTLPVFFYKAIIGLKNPFDCAVCLCEFEADDKLRLLPKCSHAFHMECIDTWLLSHSTCPLCRGSLLPDFSANNSCSPIVLVLESGSESSREIASDREAVHGNNLVTGTSIHLGIHGEGDLGLPCNVISQKSGEIPVKQDAVPLVSEEKVVSVKLGKYRNVDNVAGGGEGSSSNSTVDARRCFSMGSFEYVMDEISSLQVAIKPAIKKQSSKKPSLPLTPGHRSAMSECDCHSSREGFKGFDVMRSNEIHKSRRIVSTENALERSKRESYSVSKIWLRSKDKPTLKEDGSSRRAFSFRFPLRRMAADDLKPPKNSCSSRRSVSEIDIAGWENGGSELSFEEEVGSCNSMELQSNASFSRTRRTLFWLMGGRQNKVVHSSSSPNV